MTWHICGVRHLSCFSFGTKKFLLSVGSPGGPAIIDYVTQTLIGMLALSGAEREHRVQQAQTWASQFNTGAAIEGYLAVYADVLKQAGCAPA